ncbi:M48 family metallopeptidase [Leptospira semungkisensis]|uniref:M48 family metallopeptidase n=1 Tax=Leptospira semungkisensis TaxID=2484985 RepID=A0A4R9G8L7_9LEPT|nr:M48 family metallopeptidase [Leptospira semungkisensis]TGK07390.1 M48 family metallopeptidase [Leptospira semungkisensis]
METDQTDKFYDGKSAIPVSGELRAEQDGLYFQGEKGSFRFAYSDILNLDEVGKEYRLELNNPQNKFAGYMIVFHSKETQGLIQKYQRSQKKNPILDLWYDTNFAIKLGFLLLTAGLVFFAYNRSLSYAYFFVPLSYDKQQSKIMSTWVRDYFPECTDPSLKSAVRKIGLKLKDKDDPFEYDIIVIDDEVFNAFAMPGGTIVVFTDLLQKTDSAEELAGILAHEMAHIHRRHGVRRQIQSAGNVLLLSLGIGSGFEGVDMLENMDSVYEVLSVTLYDQKFSREYETEADEIALEKLKKANVTGSGFLTFFERFKAYETSEKDGSDENNSSEESEKDKVSNSENSGEASKGSESDASEEESKSFRVPDFLSSHPATDDRIQYVKDTISKPGYPRGKLGFSKAEWNKIKNRCSSVPPKKKIELDL